MHLFLLYLCPYELNLSETLSANSKMPDLIFYPQQATWLKLLPMQWQMQAMWKPMSTKVTLQIRLISKNSFSYILTWNSYCGVIEHLVLTQNVDFFLYENFFDFNWDMLWNFNWTQANGCIRIVRVWRSSCSPTLIFSRVTRNSLWKLEILKIITSGPFNQPFLNNQYRILESTP